MLVTIQYGDLKADVFEIPETDTPDGDDLMDKARELLITNFGVDCEDSDDIDGSAVENRAQDLAYVLIVWLIASLWAALSRSDTMERMVLAMELRAFNLMPGAVLELDFSTVRDVYPNIGWDSGERIVIIAIIRDCDKELVTAQVRMSDRMDTRRVIFSWDFCDKVNLVGLCVNPDDDDNEDFGYSPA